ncbi:pilus assembly protein [Pseudotabrizicola algicola]|uniref:Pilus assembly protein n=1 Tax=Pseudotabrizicola algicola TaxID=2709381 RepID=A0A6B3RPH7_9RHOB|nr:pilus assembly protein [Pseudotabrizicola algicola]NEX47136.1 pilus assembly protein [Pseudotabrizicola algicola]
MSNRTLGSFFNVKRFRDCEDGAVTVDWVVLTASTVGLAIWLFTVITEEHFRAAAVSINQDIQEATSRD